MRVAVFIAKASQELTLSRQYQMPGDSGNGPTPYQLKHRVFAGGVRQWYNSGDCTVLRTLLAEQPEGLCSTVLFKKQEDDHARRTVVAPEPYRLSGHSGELIPIAFERMLKGNLNERRGQTIRQIGVYVGGTIKLVTSGDSVDRPTYDALVAAGAVQPFLFDQAARSQSHQTHQEERRSEV
ncbi:MAG: hypothetical protein AMXMBFR84_08620 [Candidatus Hydrogenedentota bacterium]